MSSYAFNSILMNGREIEIDHILNGSPTPHSPFEASTFSFIEKWFNGIEEFVQHTSGSTGAPKAIPLKRHQMMASARLTAEALKLKSGDHALVCLDTEYIAGKMMLARCFVTNMKVIAVTPSANPLRELPSTLSIDFVAMVPLQLYELLQHEASRFDKIKRVIVGGASLNKEAQKKLQEFACEVYATYGMTETVSHIALQRINGASNSEHFAVLPGVKISSDDRGCLEIEAEYLEKKIYTNDLVEIKDADHFKWIGRVDNIINSGGIKVIPEKIETEIEHVMDKLNIKNRFLISSIPDSRLGNKVILLIEGSIKSDQIEEIKSQVKPILPLPQNPKEIFMNVDFQFTSNGKINRLQTRKIFLLQNNLYMKNPF